MLFVERMLASVLHILTVVLQGLYCETAIGLSMAV